MKIENDEDKNILLKVINIFSKINMPFEGWVDVYEKIKEILGEYECEKQS